MSFYSTLKLVLLAPKGVFSFPKNLWYFTVLYKYLILYCTMQSKKKLNVYLWCQSLLFYIFCFHSEIHLEICCFSVSLACFTLLGSIGFDPLNLKKIHALTKSHFVHQISAFLKIRWNHILLMFSSLCRKQFWPCAYRVIGIFKLFKQIKI